MHKEGLDLCLKRGKDMRKEGVLNEAQLTKKSVNGLQHALERTWCLFEQLMQGQDTCFVLSLLVGKSWAFGLGLFYLGST